MLPLVLAAAGGAIAYKVLLDRREFAARFPSVDFESVRSKEPLFTVQLSALEALGRHRDALAQVRAYLERHPDSVFGRTHLAELAAKTGDLLLAREQFDELLKRDPNSPIGHYGAGYYAHLLEDADAAREHFERMLALEPTSSLAPSLRSLLQLLENRARRRRSA